MYCCLYRNSEVKCYNYSRWASACLLGRVSLQSGQDSAAGERRWCRCSLTFKLELPGQGRRSWALRARRRGRAGAVRAGAAGK